MSLVWFKSVFVEENCLVYWTNQRSNIPLEKRAGFYLPSRVTVMVLVLVPQCKLLWVGLLNHLVRHLFTHSLKNKVIKHSTLTTHPQLLVSSVMYQEDVQHLSHWVSSTARRELPAPPPSEWCVSAGWSKLSGLTDDALPRNPSVQLQTGKDHMKETLDPTTEDTNRINWSHLSLDYLQLQRTHD